MSMKTGWLWFDNDPKRTLEEKVERAVKFYQQKYNAHPTTCYVNPAMFPEGVKELTIGQIRVLTRRATEYNYFWLGPLNSSKENPDA